MAGAFLILLREGLEAALIVGIILAVLGRLDQMRHVRMVYAGVGVAFIASIVFAVAADGLSDMFEGAGQEVLNGIVLMAAAVMITYVLVWLRESRKHMYDDITQQVQGNVTRGVGIFVLAFVSVFREGAESVLFLWGVMSGTGESVGRVVTGGLLGLAAAVVVAWLLFQGGRRIPLRQFFNVTTLLLVVLAAGMLARGVGFWVAVDWLPALMYSVWDTGAILSERSSLGGVLVILAGYNANPTLMEVLVYFGYLGGVAVWLMAGARSGPQPSRSEAH